MPNPSPTLARLSFQLPPAQLSAFESAYEQKLLPILQKHGLTPSSERGRPPAEGFFCRLFEVQSPSAMIEARQALDRDPAWREALRDFGIGFGAMAPDGVEQTLHLGIYACPAVPGKSVPVGHGQACWRTYGGTDGLADNWVWSVCQDREGNMWFGTEAGVNRYDGQTFTKFTTDDGLAHNAVLSIFQDREGYLWFGTPDGVSRYDGQAFISFTTQDGLAHNAVLSIFQDREGYLWFGTGWHLRIRGSGVSRYDGQTFTNFTTQDGLANNTVVSISQDRDGYLWFGTGGGVSRYDGRTWTTFTSEDGLAHDMVLSVFQDREGFLWFGTWHRGVSRYDGRDWSTFTTENGLSGNWVRSIHQDREGFLWFGTGGGGVSRYDGRVSTAFSSEEGWAHHEVRSVLQDREGCLWFGTSGGGASRYDGETLTAFTVWDGLGDDLVRSIFQDREGCLWFGTSGGGVSRYDGEILATFTTQDGLLSNSIFSIFQDRDGYLWFGTQGGGISRYDGKTFASYTTENGLAHDDDVRCIFQDREGILWFGTYGRGVSRYDGESFTTLTEEDGLAGNKVRSIFQDREGGLWFGTTGGGVSRYDGRKFATFTADDGLAHNVVSSISEDREGHLWFGTFGGASRYDGRVFQRLTRYDGLPSDTVWSVCQDRDGDIWLGTSSGVTRFRQPHPVPPSVAVDVVVADRRYDASDAVTVPATGGLVTFEFHGSNLKTRSGAMVYRYRLKEYDDAWRNTFEERVEYQDLPAGEYTFEVLAVDRDLVYSEQPATVVLTVSQDARDARIEELERRVRERTEKLEEANTALSAANKELFRVNVSLERDNALQRVRAEVASMEKSEDLGRMLGLVFKEARGIGVDMDFVNVGVIDEATDTLHYYLCLAKEAPLYAPDELPAPIAGLEGEVNVYRSEEQEKFSTATRLLKSGKGEISAFPDDMLAARQELGRRIWGNNFSISLETLDRSNVLVPFSHGFFQFASAKRDHFTEDDLVIAQDFADMVSLGYARFLDFQQLEEQARERAKEAALARIRAEVTSMRSQEDWVRILKLLLEEVQNVGLHTDVANVVVIDEASEHRRQYMIASEAFRSEIQERLGSGPWDRGLWVIDDPTDDRHVEVWRSQKGCIDDLDEEQTQARLLYLKDLLGMDLSSSPDLVAVSDLIVPFPQGVLAFTRRKTQTFTKADVAIASDFAEVVSLGYARYQDFVQLEEQNRALEEANRQVVEATRLKSQFLATMSHELRTPMNAIIGFTRIVLRRGGDALAPRHRENLQKVMQSADDLLTLINDILDLSKIEAGRVDMKPSTFSLEKLVASCCATLGPTLGKAAVVLRYEVADNIGEVNTDEARLRQVVINLLTNALKFTEKGEVVVRAERENGGLVVSVSDTGIGIPEDAQEAIFQEFRQVDGSTTRKHQGSGLGLSIVRRLAELLGGTISVESEVGVGSTFTVRIPVTYGQPLRPRADAPPSPVPGPPSGGEEGARTIVSIDDDPNVAVLLREELAEDGYRVVSATNADEGVALVKKVKPVAVTVDIVMPGKDGWETIAMLKADPETRDIPVIVLSVSDNRDLGYRLGVSDYLVKPVDRDSLLAALGRLDHGSVNDVLVVDDDRTTVLMLSQMLEINGFAPRGASNGQEALDEIAKRLPDAILLDLMMPVMDGFEVVERLVANPDWRNIPVLVVTAKDLTPDEVEFLHQRVSRVVQKGDLDPDDLGASLREILKRYHQEG